MARLRFEAKRKKAAELKARGYTWAEIAAQFRYKTADNAHKAFATKDREAWQKLYVKAVDAFLAQDVEMSAVMTNMKLLKLADDPDRGMKQIAQSAAHSLQVHCARLRATKVEFEDKTKRERADEELIERIRQESDRLADTGGTGAESAVACEPAGECEGEQGDTGGT